MDKTINYLQNPMKVGVLNERLTVDFCGLRNHLRRLGEGWIREFKKEKGNEKKSVLTSLRETIHESWLNEVREAMDQLSSGSVSFLENLSEILYVFAQSEDFPQDAKDLFQDEIATKSLDGKIKKRWIGKAKPPVIFDAHIVPEVKDVFSIEMKPISKDKWFFDTVTIKGDGDITFKKCLMGIPSLKNNTTIMKKERKFSTRYAFRPYPLAVQLWLADESSISIPSDLKSFLRVAIRYFFSSEWRTSIVLSAISVESMLSDFYEEEFKKSCSRHRFGRPIS